MSGNFLKRSLRVSFTLANGTFGSTGSDTIQFTGLRMMATIQGPTPESPGAGMQLQVFGLPPSVMNQINTLGTTLAYSVNANTVLLEAGSGGGGYSIVFRGGINNASIDYSNAPEVFLSIVSVGAADEALRAVPPLSFAGGTDAAIIMNKVAESAGWQFENSGVSGVMLSNPYFPGTAVEQARRCAQHARINHIIDSSTSPNTLAIWPRGGSRQSSGDIPLVSKDTGMIGYPNFWLQGIVVDTLFNPNLRVGGQVRVESDVPQAVGTWTIRTCDHVLSSEAVNGEWRSHFWTTAPGQSFASSPVA